MHVEALFMCNYGLRLLMLLFSTCLYNHYGLIYRIENDKVGTYSITQSFNKQENWTKALKYTLCNLKWALFWFIGNTNFQPLTSVASSHAEVPEIGSLYRRGTDSKLESRNTSNP